MPHHPQLAAGASTGGRCAERDRPWVLATTILASAMAFIDGSVITIALPVVQRDFGAGMGALQWVVNGYTLFLGALILVGGAAGDRFGRRRLFVLGTILFAAASLGCALAPGVPALIGARAAQGMGAALMVPQSLAIISAAFPRAERGRAIGTWAGASALTTALGPVVGGFLVDTLGWRAAFWMNLPLSAMVVVLAWRYVPESRMPRDGPLDWAGGLLAVVAAAALTLGLTALGQPGGGIIAAGLVMLGIGATLAFLRVERTAELPLVPLELFASRMFWGANLLTLFLYGALTGVLFLLPFELIVRRGMSASAVGLVMLPLGLIIGIFARSAGSLSDRLGVRLMLAGGAALVALAAGWLSMALESLWAGVVLPLVLLACGMALVVAPLTTAVMNAAPDARAGAASGINNAASRLAGLFSVALVGAVTALVYRAAGGSGSFGIPAPGASGNAALSAAFGTAWQAGMLASAALAVLAVMIAWLTLRASGRDLPMRGP